MNIDWFITRVCDQAKFCGFCYAPWNFFPPDVSADHALKICERFSEIGTETVTICGGEPFMYPALDLVVKELHRLGIKVVLYTSATSDRHDLIGLLPYIDFLSLPVDAVSPTAVNNMRGESQFVRVSSVLEKLSRISSRPKIKVGTVVTRQNINDLEAVSDFLHKFGIVDIWRLYEFSPYGIGEHNKRRFVLTKSEFEQVVARVRLHNEGREEHSFAISERSREENEGYCIIIDSGGSLYRYAERYIPLGLTVYDSPETILRQYDQEKHRRQKAWHFVQATKQGAL